MCQHRINPYKINGFRVLHCELHGVCRENLSACNDRIQARTACGKTWILCTTTATTQAVCILHGPSLRIRRAATERRACCSARKTQIVISAARCCPTTSGGQQRQTICSWSSSRQCRMQDFVAAGLHPQQGLLKIDDIYVKFIVCDLRQPHA